MRGKHPNSQKNLKPFGKGESGNPSGRTKSFSGLKDDLKKQVNSKHDIYFEYTNKELISEKEKYSILPSYEKNLDQHKLKKNNNINKNSEDLFCEFIDNKNTYEVHV